MEDMFNKGSEKWFTLKLMDWNTNKNSRTMPWKGEKNPYKIWLSEIILQQTRVEQGLEYYKKFIIEFPNVQALAAAEENRVFKLWEGLGYYSRCRNLIKAARLIAFECNGVFPDKYETILQLPGVGPYSAAAISSFAFNLKHAVLDGNVYRVLSRFFGISQAIDSSEGKKLFQLLADKLIDAKFPGIYNQAIMDFGATICKPQPDCGSCPLSKKCHAFQEERVSFYPVKSKRLQKKSLWFYYFITSMKGKYFYRRREDAGIWKGLHEFILYQSEKPVDPASLCTKVLKTKPLRVNSISEIRKQELTHLTIHGTFLQVQMPSGFKMKGYELATGSELSQKAFPRLIAKYLEHNPL